MILITGASSYVGARLYSDLTRHSDVVGTYHKNQLFPELVQLDITNKDAVARVVRELKPSVIIHVAGNPSASFCEKHPEIAVKLNEEGTGNVVDAANMVKAKVIYISTFAAIEPTNQYGKTKRGGEVHVEAARGVILRPSLIIGYSPNTTNDRPHNRMLRNIVEKTPAVYDTSWKFQPTWLGHISKCIEAILEKNITNQTIPIAISELKSRYDIAKDILSGFGVSVMPEDKGDKTPALQLLLEELAQLGLPVYSYEEIIAKTIEEMKANIYI